MSPSPPPLKRFAVHVAFSYSSEDAEYVHRVGEALPKEIKVHDYKTREGIIKVVGLDLKKTLKDIYQYEAMFVFAFISRAYAKSDYAQIEWEAANRAAKHKRGYVIPVRIEETDMVISQTWLDGTLPADQLAKLIECIIRRPPPRPWWFYLSTQVKIAVAAVLLAMVVVAYPAYRMIWPSRTTLKSADANVDGIIAHVVNDGPKSATIVGKRLKFGSLPIEDSDLRLDKSESPTIASGERDVKLITMALATKCGADGFLMNKRQVEPLLGQQPITLEIDIRESDDTPGKSRRRIVTFPAARLKPLVRRLVSGYETLCP
jgi:hypothetical protein